MPVNGAEHWGGGGAGKKKFFYEMKAFFFFSGFNLKYSSWICRFYQVLQEKQNECSHCCRSPVTSFMKMQNEARVWKVKREIERERETRKFFFLSFSLFPPFFSPYFLPFSPGLSSLFHVRFGMQPESVNDSYIFDIWSLVCDRANEDPNE